MKHLIKTSLLFFLFFGFAYGEDGNWPQFRGKQAMGVADTHPVPLEWDVDEMENVLFKTPIPGLGHSCPAIWGDKLFVTTATYENGEQALKIGLYGSIDPEEEDGDFTWRLYCLHKKTGKILWMKIASEGKVKVKRHPKSSHASATFCTNGKVVVAYFESEGLHCYDMEGNLKWTKDLGVVDQGFFRMPKAQWGGGASPVIHDNLLLLQCDMIKDSFIAAYNLEDGKEVWKTPRDENPTWSTPTVHTGKHPQVIANGYKHIGGYDLKTGKEIWKMVGGGDIPVPTPLVAHGLIFITNSHGRMRPIYAIKTSAKGDISLKDMAESNEHIPWCNRRGGNYMPTPIIYKEHLYCCNDRGTVTCYEAKTGKAVYQKQISRNPAFTASPVIGKGHIYWPSEKGVVYVIKTGPEYDIVAKNFLNEPCLASPALSEGVLYFRTRHHLMAIGEKK